MDSGGAWFSWTEYIPGLCWFSCPVPAIPDGPRFWVKSLASPPSTVVDGMYVTKYGPSRHGRGLAGKTPVKPAVSGSWLFKQVGTDIIFEGSSVFLADAPCLTVGGSVETNWIFS